MFRGCSFTLAISTDMQTFNFAAVNSVFIECFFYCVIVSTVYFHLGLRWRVREDVCAANILSSLIEDIGWKIAATLLIVRHIINVTDVHVQWNDGVTFECHYLSCYLRVDKTLFVSVSISLLWLRAFYLCLLWTSVKDNDNNESN